MNSLSISEQKLLVNLLNRVEPGFLPAEIFYAITKLVVTATYTIVPLFSDDELSVHLTYKENNDPHWSGLLHTPGKVILPTDKSIDDVYKRLYRDEINGLNMQGGPIFCGYVFNEIPRGKEIAIINYALLKSKPDYGELYNVKKLPQNLIPTEIERIEMAVKKFQKKN